MYNGPDVDHQGQEICIGSNENAISIVDVTEKLNPKFLGVGWIPVRPVCSSGLVVRRP